MSKMINSRMLRIATINTEKYCTYEYKSIDTKQMEENKIL